MLITSVSEEQKRTKENVVWEKYEWKYAYWSSRKIGWTIKSGEYDLIAPAADGEQMTWLRSAPYTYSKKQKGQK